MIINNCLFSTIIATKLQMRSNNVNNLYNVRLQLSSTPEVVVLMTAFNEVMSALHG